MSYISKPINILPGFIKILIFLCITTAGCAVITVPYKVTKSTIKGCIWVVKGTYEFTAGVTKLTYKIGEFSFEVVRAPPEWTLLNKDIETIY
jgi:rare lipoprotein A